MPIHTKIIISLVLLFLLFFVPLEYCRRKLQRISLGQGSAIATKIVAAKDTVNKLAADYVCDGQDDDLTIEKAMAGLPATGGMVFLLPGTYHLSSAIDIERSNIILRGAGMGATKILFGKNNDTNGAIQVGLTGVVYNIVLSSFEIDGQRHLQDTNHDGIYIEGGRQMVVEKIYSHDNYLRGIVANGKNINIINNFVENNEGEAISIAGTDNLVANNYAKDGYDGIVLCAGQNRVENNYREGGHWGILVYSDDNIITGNYVFQTGGGISIDGHHGGGHNNVVSDNQIIATLRGHGLSVALGAKHNIISNNIIRNSQLSGVTIGHQSESNVVSNNLFQDNSRIGHGQYADIWIADGSKFNNISANNIISQTEIKTSYGVLEETKQDDYNIISDNIIYGTVSGILSKGIHSLLKDNIISND